MSVQNSYVNGDYCYMNISTGYESKNYNYIDYINKRDEMSANIYLMGNNGFPDGVGIGVILTGSAPNQYSNIEYNNKINNLLRNGNVLTSNKSSFSTLTSPSVTSTNEKLYSLLSPIHEKIKYSDLFKTQSRAVRHAGDVMKPQIKLLAIKTWHSVILGYLFNYKDTKEVVSVIYIITTSSTH